MSADKVLQMIKENEVQFVDLRFTDTRGKEQHVSIRATTIDASFFTEGKMFDGSSIAGWRAIHKSDMVLMPDAQSAVMDPFFEENTLIIRCDVLEPNLEPYSRDPRSVAKRAEDYLKSTGIADTCYFGPEPEFFVFDDVAYNVDISGAFYSVDAKEAAWNSAAEYEGGNNGHRPGIKGGYFPVPPVDSGQDLRSEMCLVLEGMGIKTELHHHEVGTAGQMEIGVLFNTLCRKADELQIFKYVVQNVANEWDKTATFMPKPLVGDNGSGMHCHQSLAKDGKNIFAGDKYAGLSETALYYIGGILKHARALNAFTNPTTNSYKRLVPGFEAPEMLAYSSCNRSASIRIPHVPSPKGRRIEVRFPDPLANPYFAFAAMLMAGLDGIQNRILPGDPADQDLYDLPAEQKCLISTVAPSLEVALEALDKDRAFLKAGNVFNDDLIDAYIELKMTEVTNLRMHTHPIEYAMYYSA
jgi:glutamine synthetase